VRGTTAAVPNAGLGALRVERCTVTDDVVGATWRRLQAEDAVPVPFLTFEWCSSLAEVPEAWNRLTVLLVRRDAEPIALFPIEWRQGFDGRFGRMPEQLVAVGPAGWQWLAPDHLDVVAAPQDREAAAEAISHHLMRHADWDVADFQGLAGGGALAAALSRRVRSPRFAVRSTQQHSPVVTLGQRSEQELLPSRNLRQQIRRGLRSAQRRGGGLSVATDPDEVALLLKDMMQLHNARFGSSSRVFATPARRRFHILAARRLAAAGRARIYRLSSGEEHAALLYALSHGRRLYYYSLGIAPDRSPSPGRTVIGQAVLSAAAEGFEEFDLLRGDHDFKWRFADHGRADLTVRALRLTPRNAVFTSPLLVRHLVRRVKRGIHTGSLV
jgi:CelD/BcsL family acetyltransferase involved in cellulose biosynthesis